ncbi:MAG: 1-acyl-sn-glycerol-3-phosphate acyltransferase [Deltaproteobacteria bacterium]|nr:1-acyl-sn-glycerol-3-phosphate acyltransferase [Deltaproteobacteria bacterium]
MKKPIRRKLTNVKTRIVERIDKSLEGTHNHFSCFLPGDIGPFPLFILRRIFSGIKTNSNQVKLLHEIPEDAIIVYANKFRSYFEHLFYYSLYQDKGLPFPEIGFDYKIFLWQPVSRLYKIALAHISFFFSNLSFPNPFESGYIRETLISGRAGLLSLIDKKRFYRWFVKAKTDPIQYLIETQHAVEQPIYIIPQLMFFSKKPIRSKASFANIMFGTETKPGKLRRILILLRNPGKVFVEISEPVNLKDFISKKENQERTIEHQALILRRNLLLQLNLHRQSITGPLLKSREEMKENILTNDNIQKYIHSYAKERDLSVQQVNKKAESYLEEIAAKYSLSMIRIFAGLVTWFTNIMFDGVVLDHNGLDRLKKASVKSPLILMPSHKSHIDYLMLSYVMFYNDMPCPHIFAGKNLSFWPMGFIFRNSGAFFVRRTFKGAALYSKIFSEYIHNLLSEGFNIEAFIEGTRSRTGKLLVPKLGFLSILIDAYKRGACKDLQFAPIYIGYDRVLEESSYLNELEGGYKKPENFMQVIKAARFLKKRYGKIYIQFHEPISLNTLLSQNNVSIDDIDYEKKTFLVKTIGNKIVHAINSITVVTPHALMASAILNCRKATFSFDHLMSSIDTYLKYLSHRDAMLTDTLTKDPVSALKQVVSIYSQRNLIEPASKQTDENVNFTEILFETNINKRPVLEYYKNNCISFFIPAAYTALEILKKGSSQFSVSDLYSGYGFLQEFLKKEFVKNIDKVPEVHVKSNIKAFVDDGILTPHQTLSNTYAIIADGQDKLKLFSSFLKPYLESSWIILNFITHNPKKTLTDKDSLKKIVSWGERLYKNNEITLKESLFTMNFKNAIAYFLNHDITDHKQTRKIEHYTSQMNNYLKYF